MKENAHYITTSDSRLPQATVLTSQLPSAFLALVTQVFVRRGDCVCPKSVCLGRLVTCDQASLTFSVAAGRYLPAATKNIRDA